MSASSPLIANDRFAATFAGDDWPKVDYAAPRYRTIPSLGQRNYDLEQWTLDITGKAGLVLDAWEEKVLFDSIRLRPDGKWGALEVGICLPRQNGKGNICYSCPMLTTDGWTVHGEIRVGQYVYGSDGKPTRVVARSEVFLVDRCYEVSFADGSSHIAGQDHLWTVWDTDKYNAEAYALTVGSQREKHSASKGGAWATLATREIAESRWCRPHPTTGRNGYCYRVRCDAIPQTPEADLPINPYVFGLWLGDGSKSKPSVTTGDEDLAYIRKALIEAGFVITGETLGNVEYLPWDVRFQFPNKYRKRDGFLGQLRRLGVFGNKHIPEIYLTASPEQRLALLQGLMDTDGSIATTNKSPQVEFTTSIPALAEGFHRLARSLGIRVAPKWRKTKKKDNCRFLWTPAFNPFRLPRKAEKYQPPSESYRRNHLMAITGVREVPSVATRCIQVEAEDGIYLIGKTFVPTHNSVLEARELIGLFADDRRFPGIASRLTIHTAHDAKTSHEGFERLAQLIEGTPRLRAKLRGRPRQSEGGEVIRLLDGRRIRFRTRTNAAARGLSGDLLIFDEAMILSNTVHGTVWPIVTARENPQIWYTGSAVDQREPLMDLHGLVFSRVRKRGIAGDEDLFYVEWSLPYESPDEVTPTVAANPESWLQSNPGLDVRLSRRIIAVEQRSLSARNFSRERLGVGDWPDPDAGNRVIAEERWTAAAGDATMLDPICLALDVAPDRSRAAIGVAGKNDAGNDQVEVIQRFRGTARVIQTLKDLTKDRRRTEIVVDGVGSAASLIPAMEAEKLNVVPVTAGEHARGCGMFYDGIMGDPENPSEPTLNHLNDPGLNAAVTGAVKRKLGDRWAWDRINSTIDISPLVVCTLALYGFLRKRQGVPSVYSAADVLDEENTEFDEAELPPLEAEDL